MQTQSPQKDASICCFGSVCVLRRVLRLNWWVREVHGPGKAIVTTGRIQLALNVSNIDSATAFYSKLFGVAPHKQRAGYANFIVADPPMKLVLIEDPTATESLNHLGVEYETSEDVHAVDEQLAARSLTTRFVHEDLCCHAIQDKVFVNAPDVPLGMWEFYTVLDDNPSAGRSVDSTCCAATPANGAVSSCCAPTDSTTETATVGGCSC
jgi:catechol 2,3-dioxygenase-like lactoylglutathione lyase family enzyme